MRPERSGKLVKMAGMAAACMAVVFAVPFVSQAAYTAQQDETGIRYVDEAGVNMPAGWQQENGRWYWINEEGYAQTRWLSLDGKWYFFDGTGAMVTGWTDVDGRYYFFKSDGAMQEGNMKDGETLYTFSPEGTAVPEGSLVSAKKEKNTGGGSFTVGFYDEARQQLADNLNELKADDFDGDEDEDYYEDDKKNYDEDASYIISGRLTEIAEHRLSMARMKGYSSEKIPEEGTLNDYLKSINYNSGRRSMEVYLLNCSDADEAESKLLRSHDKDEKERRDRAVYYKELGIAQETVNGKNYYMVIFMR